MTSPRFSLRLLGSGLAAASLFLSSCSQSQHQGSVSVTPSGTADPNAGNGIPSNNDQPAPPPAKPKKRSDYPLATRIEGKTSQVISPFKPHNIIDVKGFRSGQLARDPSTAPIDPATGKPDLSQAKIFELP